MLFGSLLLTRNFWDSNWEVLLFFNCFFLFSYLIFISMSFNFDIVNYLDYAGMAPCSSYFTSCWDGFGYGCRLSQLFQFSLFIIATDATVWYSHHIPKAEWYDITSNFLKRYLNSLYWLNSFLWDKCFLFLDLDSYLHL